MFCDTPLVAEPETVATSKVRARRKVANEEWPYSFEILHVDDLFIDDSYQRPLTNFVGRIRRLFDPALVGTLVVSERGGSYAVVDGQTRAAAVRELAAAGRAPKEVPCLVYRGLSRAEEASLFARLQKERRGISSYHRFRAAVVAGELEANAIQRIVEDAGYDTGYGPNHISAVAGLEKVYRRSPQILDLVLMIIRNAWGERHMPKGDVLRGLGCFLDHVENVDEERLTARLATVTPAELARRSSALREGADRGGSDKYMAEAIEAVYNSRHMRAAV